MQASKKPSNSAKPKPTVANCKRQQTSQGDAGKQKKNKTADPQLTEAEKAKDDQLVSGQLANSAPLSLPPGSGEAPGVGDALTPKQSKKPKSSTSAIKATRVQKAKGVARSTPTKDDPPLVPVVGVGYIKEVVEAAIEQVDLDVGVPEAIREAVKLEIEDLMDFMDFAVCTVFSLLLFSLAEYFNS